MPVSASQGSGSAATTSSSQDGTGESSGVDSASGSGGMQMKLDVEEGTINSCQSVDLLFVIDNSQSMQTYQQALADAFPGFIDAMYEALPEGIDVHVGITTTDFDRNCAASEATANCQSSATLEEVQSHYVPPTEANDGGNGTQGRLFEWSGQRWFSANTSEDPQALTTWFSAAATAAGEDGCSFEMPVAAAGWAVDPANGSTNDGFVRDEHALLVLFFLTDEPDKSPESKNVHADQLRAAKQGCGGEQCIFVSGLIPACVPEINQKLWQLMTELTDEPIWGDIQQTNAYGQVVGEALAVAVADACVELAG